MPHRVLDPLERTSEVLFGLIMVLTFTGSISVAEAGRAETASVLVAALACNLAWGLVDAAMFVLASVTERARGLKALQAVRQAGDPDAARRLILDALPGPVAAALQPAEVENLRQRLRQQPEPAASVGIGRRDLLGALGVFLLVFLSTLPVVAPFLVFGEIQTAMRASNAVAVVMLFAAGWSLGHYAGRPPWRTGLGMVAVGAILVAITMALGG